MNCLSMRSSLGLGISLVALGVLCSFVATSLMGSAGAGFTFFASSFGAVLFLFAASVLFGLGVAFMIHWFADLAGTFVALIVQAVFGLGFFFTGLGLAIGSRNWWFAIHAFFACTVASITLFFLAFTTLVHRAVRGTKSVAYQVSKKLHSKKPSSKKRKR